MNPEVNGLFNQFIQEVATKSGDLLIATAKHTGFFVSFYEVGNTVASIFKTLFK